MADHKRGRGALDSDEVHLRGDEEGNSERKSAKAIRVVREVTILLHQTTDQPGKHVTAGARFSKVPKLFGHTSGDIIFIVSSERRRLEARNFPAILIVIPFTTYGKTSFTD